MAYSLAEAAAAVGLNKSTILRALQRGVISGTKDDDGRWSVEPAELHRWKPPVAVADAGTEAPHHDAMTDALVAELRAVIADVRADRDHWREIAARLSLAPPQPARRRWWRMGIR